MIGNVTPSVNFYEETLNTLNYANRAKNIKVVLKKNIIENNELLSSHSSPKKDGMINSLKNEIIQLKKLLKERYDSKNIGNLFNLIILKFR